MLRACVQRFDVTRNLEKFCKILKTKQALSLQVVVPSTGHAKATWYSSRGAEVQSTAIYKLPDNT